MDNFMETYRTTGLGASYGGIAREISGVIPENICGKITNKFLKAYLQKYLTVFENSCEITHEFLKEAFEKLLDNPYKSTFESVSLERLLR